MLLTLASALSWRRSQSLDLCGSGQQDLWKRLYGTLIFAFSFRSLREVIYFFINLSAQAGGWRRNGGFARFPIMHSVKHQPLRQTSTAGESEARHKTCEHQNLNTLNGHLSSQYPSTRISIVYPRSIVFSRSNTRSVNPKMALPLRNGRKEKSSLQGQPTVYVHRSYPLSSSQTNAEKESWVSLRETNI